MVLKNLKLACVCRAQFPLKYIGVHAAAKPSIPLNIARIVCNLRILSSFEPWRMPSNGTNFKQQKLERALGKEIGSKSHPHILLNLFNDLFIIDLQRSNIL